MRTQIFKDIAESYASAIGRRDGVKVVFAGSQAMTDNKVIVVPVESDQAYTLRSSRPAAFVRAE